MKNYIFNIILLSLSFGGFAQVGIGTIAPAAGSVLELKATDKALILTRVAGSTAIAAPVDGMLVYDSSL
ncbi:MAG: hypothetical protein RIQ59_1119, partial [Bacteroidota bacterium]